MWPYHLRHPTDRTLPRRSLPDHRLLSLLGRWFIYLAHSSWRRRFAAKGLEKGHLTTERETKRRATTRGNYLSLPSTGSWTHYFSGFPLAGFDGRSRKKCHRNLLLFAWFASGLQIAPRLKRRHTLHIYKVVSFVDGSWWSVLMMIWTQNTAKKTGISFQKEERDERRAVVIDSSVMSMGTGCQKRSFVPGSCCSGLSLMSLTWL